MPVMAAIKGSAAPGRAVALALIGGAFLTVSDSGLKWLAGELAAGQIMSLRGFVAAAFLCSVTLVLRGPAALLPRSYKLHLIRGVFAAIATFTYLVGVPHLQLATATSILFAAPIFLTALAPFLIGEQVGWRRWSAVIVGFIGVMVIVRPAGTGLVEGYHWAAFMILVAALGEAFRDLITRGASGRETTHSLLLSVTLVAAVGGLCLPPYLPDWPAMNARHWLVLTGATALWTVAHFLLIEAFRFGEAALLAPFRYCNLFYAALMGFIIWGDLPDVWTWVGSAVIISSGLYILHREVLRRAPLAQTATIVQPEKGTHKGE